MADEVPPADVLNTVFPLVGELICYAASFPVAFAIVFGGMKLGKCIYSCPSKRATTNDLLADIETSERYAATDETPADPTGYMYDEGVLSCVLKVSIYVLNPFFQFLLLLIFSAEENVEFKDWTMWDRIGASLLAWTLLAAAGLGLVASVRVMSWLIEWACRAAGNSKTTYHPLQDLGGDGTEPKTASVDESEVV